MVHSKTGLTEADGVEVGVGGVVGVLVGVGGADVLVGVGEAGVPVGVLVATGVGVFVLQLAVVMLEGALAKPVAPIACA